MDKPEPPFAKDAELHYQQTSWPGARLPHAWVFSDTGAKISTLDLTGHGEFTRAHGHRRSGLDRRGKDRRQGARPATSQLTPSARASTGRISPAIGRAPARCATAASCWSALTITVGLARAKRLLTIRLRSCAASCQIHPDK